MGGSLLCLPLSGTIGYSGALKVYLVAEEWWTKVLLEYPVSLILHSQIVCRLSSPKLWRSWELVGTRSNRQWFKEGIFWNGMFLRSQIHYLHYLSCQNVLSVTRTEYKSHRLIYIYVFILFIYLYILTLILLVWRTVIRLSLSKTSELPVALEVSHINRGKNTFYNVRRLGLACWVM